MNVTGQAAKAQEALWNGLGGHAWVEAQESIDRMFQPFETMLVEAVSATRPTRVLDIGCGAGATTLAVARRLGTAASCAGVDISEPMIAAAQARAAREGTPATFLRANAETHPFEPGAFDAILSRFGVMFFEDSVRAFANLRRAAVGSAALRFLAWRSAAENPFMTAAERAAAPLLPDLPPRREDEPGQFGFADRRRVEAILAQSGWAEIDIQPVDVVCTLPHEELLPYATRIGPVGRILQQLDEPARIQVVETVRASFDPYVHGGEVRYTAACWMVSATAP